VLGAAWAVWHLPLFFITGTVQHEFGLAQLERTAVQPQRLPDGPLTGLAYEVAGVVASIAVHFGVNTTMALLTVKSPATQAAVVAAVLLASRRSRPATLSPTNAVYGADSERVCRWRAGRVANRSGCILPPAGDKRATEMRISVETGTAEGAPSAHPGIWVVRTHTHLTCKNVVQGVSCS
jgi:hypothetical protein